MYVKKPTLSMITLLLCAFCLQYFLVIFMNDNIDLRIIKTKRNLYDGLLQLLCKQPFEEIKIKDICDISLTSRSTFYDHFNNKYELLDYLIDDLKKDIVSKMNINRNASSTKKIYLSALTLILDILDENINIYRSMLKHNNNSVVVDILNNALYKDVEETLNDHGTKLDVPIEIITKFYVNGVVSICLLYIQYPNKYEKEDLIKYFDILIPEEL